MARIFDHIDLRVPDLVAATPFYSVLLPELGFTRGSDIPGWLQFYAEPERKEDEGIRERSKNSGTAFFGIADCPGHVANATRIAFWAENLADVDRLAVLLGKIGAQNVEGPAWEHPGYYAVFFEDPFGNRLEVCHRMENHGQLPVVEDQ